MYSSVAFSPFMMLYNYHLYLVFKHSHHVEGNLHPLSNHFLSPAPGNHRLAFGLHRVCLFWTSGTQREGGSLISFLASDFPSSTSGLRLHIQASSWTTVFPLSPTFNPSAKWMHFASEVRVSCTRLLSWVAAILVLVQASSISRLRFCDSCQHASLRPP